ncbi:hypothetical protein HDA37_001620 [Pseudonocardia antarctica]|uniref:Uncharacterized protein n=1 Tax=Pseudonocardia alni TaxID=33907 RepID=A0A852W4N4_PSEA5|nr:hypothetical protein [Pseudonocardia antarctica]
MSPHRRPRRHVVRARGQHHERLPELPELPRTAEAAEVWPSTTDRDVETGTRNDSGPETTR